MAVAQAYSCASILEAIRLRLVDQLEIDDHFVRLVGNDDYQVTVEQKFVAIRPLGPVPFTNAGAGRRARPMKRSVRVYLHLRSSLDYAGDDRILVPLLCNFEDQVYDALDDWFPTDTDGNRLTYEPLHPTDSGNGPPTRKSVNDVGETFSRLDFELAYLQINSATPPA